MARKTAPGWRYYDTLPGGSTRWIDPSGNLVGRRAHDNALAKQSGWHDAESSRLAYRTAKVGRAKVIGWIKDAIEGAQGIEGKELQREARIATENYVRALYDDRGKRLPKSKVDMTYGGAYQQWLEGMGYIELGTDPDTWRGYVNKKR